MGISREEFGKLSDGTMVNKYVLTNSNGMKAEFINIGADIVSLYAPDRNGNMKDVMLGYNTLSGYMNNGENLGAVVGRVANRIEAGKFTLNGKEYQLDINNGANCLHNGFDAYNSRFWNADEEDTEFGSSVIFSLHSPDGDQGMPGAIDITVRYTLTPDNALMLEYTGISDQDTLFNITNHAYFNMEGCDSDSVLEQKVWIDADKYTVADSGSIPHGELADVKGTPMDFTKEMAIGDRIESDYEQLVLGNGYDHNWVFNTPDEDVRLVASISDDKSGRTMEVYTDLPGMQFYTGNFLDGSSIGKNGRPITRRSGACFETQFFPNAINVPSFKKPILKAGELFTTTTIYKFITK